MRVLVAMSGGVDSSVAAALLVAGGHEVVGATLKLWGGPSDSGCCSVADVDDARRVAQQLGIAHHVFNMADEFADLVVAPYVAAHGAGRTPNPCIECNRRIKFDRLLERSCRLGFDRLATGHHARVVGAPGGRWMLRRGADGNKDQSYVLSMLGQEALGRILLPVGDLTKGEVRAEAARLGLRTADKPDSQDVCFIHGAVGRDGFLSERLPLHPGVVVDEESGDALGTVDSVELVTVGQRRGLMAVAGERRYAVDVDVGARRVTVAPARRAVVDEAVLEPGTVTWVDQALPDGAPAVAQTSAHGRPAPCSVHHGAAANDGAGPVQGASVLVRFDEPQRPVAPGQTLALYDAGDPDSVLGAGIVSAAPRLAGRAR
jgi:tRNA-uridine 2-sulfurtransferase